MGIVNFRLTFAGSGVPAYAIRAARATAIKDTAAAIPSLFSPFACAAALVLEGLGDVEVFEAVEAVVAVGGGSFESVESPGISVAWWMRMIIPRDATPTNSVASAVENEVVVTDTACVPVTIIRSPVIVCPPTIHVPLSVSIASCA